MAVLKPNSVPLTAFTFVADENLLVAEASSLPPFGRVYDDACDEGYTLVLAKNEIVYVVTGIHRPDDLLWWDLEPVERTLGDNPPTIRVFND